MDITRHSIIETKTTTYSTISLADHEVASAVGAATNIPAALAAAARAGQFSPVTASATDTVGVDLRPDSSAVIVVVAVTTVTTLPPGNSSSS